jgi:hypothetical protein
VAEAEAAEGVLGMAKEKKPGLRGLPRTGDGYTAGKKPKTEDLRVLRRDNTMHSRAQPPGWGAKIFKFVKREGKG